MVDVGIGLPIPMLSEMIDGTILKKGRAVIADSDHALHVPLSGRRLMRTQCNRNDIAAFLNIWRSQCCFCILQFISFV